MKEVLPASSGWMNSVQTEGEVKSARGNITIIPKGCQDYGQATIWNRKRAQILCTVLANGLYNGCTSSLVQLRIHSNLIRPSEFASSMLLWNVISVILHGVMTYDHHLCISRDSRLKICTQRYIYIYIYIYPFLQRCNYNAMHSQAQH